MRLMESERPDLTLLFRTYYDTGELPEAFQQWGETWWRPEIPPTPTYIPRNAHLHRALERAVGGDMTAYLTMLEAVTHPYTADARFRGLEGPGEEIAGFQTYCGT